MSKETQTSNLKLMQSKRRNKAAKSGSSLAACSLSSGIKEINRVHGTDFTLGQVVSYDAGKGRGRRMATITGHEDGFLKIMRDGDNYENGALWDPGDLIPENKHV